MKSHDAVANDPLSSWPSYRPVLIVVAVSALITISHLVLRTGFVLDDWYMLSDAKFGGIWKAGTVMAWSRPGQWLVYTFTFGIFGRHPIFYVLVLGATSVLIAVLLFVLLRGFLPPTIALLVTLVWLFLPNHTTMEVWASAVNIDVAVLALIAGLLIGLRPKRSTLLLVVSVALLALAMLTYEATAPVAAAGVLLLPLVRYRRVDWKWVGSGAMALGPSALWMLKHWTRTKEVVSDPAATLQVVSAHFGWGVVPKGVPSTIATLVVLVVSVAAIESTVVTRRRTGPAEWCVIAGWVVILLSLIPFFFYLYGPLGMGDRANCVSSIGGALVWVGVGMTAWKSRREVAVGGALLLLVAASVSRLQRANTWSTAFGDADRILVTMHRQLPRPTGQIVIGPVPIQHENIAAFLDNSNIDKAVKVEYGSRKASAAVSYSAQLFFSIPACRRFDIRPVSRLRPDTDLSNHSP